MQSRSENDLKILKIAERIIVRVNKKRKERSNKRKSGSKGIKKLTKGHKVLIYRVIAKNPFLSCLDIQSQLKLSVSPECIRLHIIKSGFWRRIPGQN